MDIMICEICREIINFTISKNDERYNNVQELKKIGEMRDWKKERARKRDSRLMEKYEEGYQDPNLLIPRILVIDFQNELKKDRRYLKPHLEFLSERGFLKHMGRKRGYILGDKIYRSTENTFAGKKLSKVFSESGKYGDEYFRLCTASDEIFKKLWKYKAEEIHWYPVFNEPMSTNPEIDSKRKLHGRIGFFGDFNDKSLVEKSIKLSKKYKVSIIVYKT